MIALTAQIGDPKASRKVMPWVLERAQPAATAEEVAAAQAQLDEGLVFV